MSRGSSHMVENKLLKVSCLDKLLVSKSLDNALQLGVILMNHIWFPIQSRALPCHKEQLQESKQDGINFHVPKVRQMYTNQQHHLPANRDPPKWLHQFRCVKNSFFT